MGDRNVKKIIAFQIFGLENKINLDQIIELYVCAKIYCALVNRSCELSCYLELHFR